MLEGGYNLDVLPHSILTTFRVLADDPRGPSDPFGPAPGAERDVRNLFGKLKALHGIKGSTYHSLPSRWMDWGDDHGIDSSHP